MKQEPGRQQPGISGLQAGEDVNDSHIPSNYSFPRQRASHFLACCKCSHFKVGETVFYCEHRKTEFPTMCVEYAPAQREEPRSLLRWVYNLVTNHE